jgi:hypothetical protein
LKLTLEAAGKVKAALSQGLDGYDRVIRDGERERVVREPYKFDAGLRLALAVLENRVDVLIADYNKARSALIKSLADGGAKVPEEKMSEFIEQHQVLLDKECEINDVGRIKTSELALDKNPIPASVLALLMPVLKVDSVSAAKAE